ncbi:uncharacterized protein LOC110729289 [Chenopodium quinoa]|uniref:uncharacterized protein LOC110729289 n=1 Tax=Chenopodium quinoa TaxID=63459 RepID=UPI000B786CAD|nr:uncharacterized protein LOC110729289 [Chenopodium quinoa]
MSDNRDEVRQSQRNSEKEESETEENTSKLRRRRGLLKKSKTLLVKDDDDQPIQTRVEKLKKSCEEKSPVVDPNLLNEIKWSYDTDTSDVPFRVKHLLQFRDGKSEPLTLMKVKNELGCSYQRYILNKNDKDVDQNKDAKTSEKDKQDYSVKKMQDKNNMQIPLRMTIRMWIKVRKMWSKIMFQKKKSHEKEKSPPKENVKVDITKTTQLNQSVENVKDDIPEAKRTAKEKSHEKEKSLPKENDSSDENSTDSGDDSEDYVYKVETELVDEEDNELEEEEFKIKPKKKKAMKEKE